MGSVRKGVGILIVLTAVAAAARIDTSLPDNPHAFMDKPGSCEECHALYRQEIEPHEFVISIPGRCRECHLEKDLGRSHPVGVDPSLSEFDIEVPDELPLEDGKVSCGSCHQPHADWLAREKSSPDEVPQVVLLDGRREVPYYKTYYLRMADPKTGFVPLCTGCHRDY